MKIELYTEVNFRGPTAKNGKCIALVECETKKGPAVKAQIETEQNTTYHRMSMIAILVGLRMLRPCEVTVYTPDQFLVTTINEGNMDKWKREEWRRPHGKEIKNKELWQELYEQMEKHRIFISLMQRVRMERQAFLLLNQPVRRTSVCIRTIQRQSLHGIPIDYSPK